MPKIDYANPRLFFYSSILIEHLEQSSKTGTFGFAWFICHCEEQQTGAALSLNLARQLLQQLLKRDTCFPAAALQIHQKYEKYESEEPIPLENECLELLQSVAAGFPKVYIVIDGLDELSGDSRGHAIKTIQALLSTHVYCAVTSRPGEQDIERAFSQLTSPLKIGANASDIRTYLEAHITKPSPLADVISATGPALKEEIISSILKSSRSM